MTTTSRRGRILAMAGAGAAVALLGLAFAATVQGLCSNGDVEVACESAPVGPSGDAVSDRFFFAHQPLTGDGSVTVRVTSLTGRIKEPPPPGAVGGGPPPVPGTVPWAKAGLMIKDGVRQGSSYAAVMVTPGHGVRLQHDFIHDTAGRPDGVSAEAPRWLRLTRAGRTVTGAESVDGLQWTDVASVELDLPETVRIGLFAASPGAVTIDQGTSAARFAELTADFDQLSLTGPLSSDDIGVGYELDGVTPHHPGGLTRSGEHYLVTGVGEVGPAENDAGLRLELLLIGTAIGLVVVAVAAARSGRRGEGYTALAVTAAVAGLIGAAIALVGGAALLARNGSPVHAVRWLVEVRLAVGTAALFAVAAVLAAALGRLLRRATAAALIVVAVLALPSLLGVTIAVLPAGIARWLLTVTPAAGFAIQQSVPAYPHASGSHLPADGFYPLSPWVGLAVAGAYAVILGWPALTARARESV